MHGNEADADGNGIVGTLRAADDSGVVRLEARFSADEDDVWSALTDPRRLAQWLGDLEGDLRPGGKVRAHFVATGWEGTLRVEACDRAERLLITTTSAGEPECVIEVTLAVEGEQTRAVFEDRGLPLGQIAAYGAGDQVLVEDLAAHLVGLDRCDARARWQELHPRYQELAEGLVRAAGNGVPPRRPGTDGPHQ
jgi:uncharacterized protein YndB with AHSA1/START domain